MILRPFAFFDFDGTLTHRDSLMPFLHYIAGTRCYYQNLLLSSPMLLKYFLRLTSNHHAKEAILHNFLAGYSEALLLEKSKEFVRNKLHHFIRPEGMKALYKYQSENYRCILVSASPKIYLQHWAYLHGFEKTIATELEVHNGILTGKINGQNCFGIVKVRNIEKHFGSSCWRNSVCYSDSLADKPMLQKCSFPYLLHKNIFKPFLATGLQQHEE